MQDVNLGIGSDAFQGHSIDWLEKIGIKISTNKRTRSVESGFRKEVRHADRKYSSATYENRHHRH